MKYYITQYKSVKGKEKHKLYESYHLDELSKLLFNIYDDFNSRLGVGCYTITINGKFHDIALPMDITDIIESYKNKKKS